MMAFVATLIDFQPRQLAAPGLWDTLRKDLALTPGDYVHLKDSAEVFDAGAYVVEISDGHCEIEVLWIDSPSMMSRRH